MNYRLLAVARAKMAGRSHAKTDYRTELFITSTIYGRSGAITEKWLPLFGAKLTARGAALADLVSYDPEAEFVVDVGTRY